MQQGRHVARNTFQKIGAPPESMNMRLVGYNYLQGSSAYQPTIHHQGNRYIAYIGHHGGTPEQIARDKRSHTGRFLARVLGNGKKREAA